MAFDLLSSVIDIGGKVLDRVIPDPKAAAEAKLELLKLHQSGELALLAADTDIAKARASVIEAEMGSGNFLAVSWRPILMLVFGGLIVARWLGWSAPNLSEAEVLKLWDIVQLGLGGYVIGRSVEKIAPTIADAIKR